MQQSALEKKDFPSILLFLVFGVCIPKVFPSAHNHDDVMLAMGTGGGGEKEATLRFWENNVIPGTRVSEEKTNCTGDADENPLLWITVQQAVLKWQQCSWEQWSALRQQETGK